ncbi:hypothetical protein [Actinocorallia populi]|uniref:hypothetical protein n=1 Tax=Actinocorallia populi TaxID=2079200 RepID=UPI000D08EA78|nr:hypothetical protein [Actinocorallia populi]
MLQTIGGTALGDFRDRVRRPVYAVTLLAAVVLGYLAVPDAQARFVILNIGGYRGVYDSAYVGTATALAAALWLTLGGFYVVRGAIEHDERTGVGRLVAATPLRTPAYLAAKFLSNVMVLGSMVGVLAATAAVMQFTRAEDRAIDPIALLTPFVVIALPMVAATAAAALLFETLPLLRGGIGNVGWFFVWLTVAVGGLSARAPVDVLGAQHVIRAFRATMTEQGIWKRHSSFSLGLTQEPEPLKSFPWGGLPLTAEFLGGRALLVVAALLVALLPALWFTRFDPARGGFRLTPRQTPATEPELPPAPAYRGLPATPPAYGNTFGRLLAGELTIIVREATAWWWLGAAILAAVGLAVPSGSVAPVALPLAWVWPVLLWSKLGTRHQSDGMESLIGAYPAPHRRLLAEWTAGLAVTALLGLTPLVRMAASGDTPGMTAWLGGALLIPSLALAAGTLTRTPRLFQALYPALWYCAFNGLAPLDFMGAVRDGDTPAGPHPLAVTALAGSLLALTLLTASARGSALLTRHA